VAGVRARRRMRDIVVRDIVLLETALKLREWEMCGERGSLSHFIFWLFWEG
jgi:hypothetical protein